MKTLLFVLCLLCVNEVCFAANSAVLTLGTKGTATTTYVGVTQATYQCRAVGTANAYTAKVGPAGISTVYVYSASGTFLGTSAKALSQLTFTAISSATRAECAVIGM